MSRRLVQHWFDAGRLTGYKIPSLRGRVTRRIKADSLRAFMVESELPVEWFDDYLADLNSQLPPSKGE